jgi:hypothetical protein
VIALYSTIWLALILFVAAEIATKYDRAGSRWPQRVSLAGALLCAVHILIALGVKYDWNHEAARRQTAVQTAAIYGVNVSAAIYTNYLFLMVWIADVSRRARWLRSPCNPTLTDWGLRAFYLLIISNAAIIFARPPIRPLGVALVLLLVWAWWPRAVINRSASQTV